MHHGIGDVCDGGGLGAEPGHHVAVQDPAYLAGAIRASPAEVVVGGGHPHPPDRGDVALKPFATEVRRGSEADQLYAWVTQRGSQTARA